MRKSSNKVIRERLIFKVTQMMTLKYQMTPSYIVKRKNLKRIWSRKLLKTTIRAK